LVANVGSRAETFDAALDQFGNFCGIQLHCFAPSLVKGCGLRKPR
jgi:hypothetical protein